MHTPCDLCNSPLIPVLWGHPMGFPDSIFELAKNGQVMIGGSCIPYDNRNSYCEKCDHYYQKYAEIPDTLPE